jgi:hypothetical protein
VDSGVCVFTGNKGFPIQRLANYVEALMPWLKWAYEELKTKEEQTVVSLFERGRSMSCYIMI